MQENENEELQPPEWMTEDAKSLWAALPKPRRGSREAVLACFGLLEGDKEEIAELQKMVDEMREADITISGPIGS